ncbi:hypothetical protein WAI453_006446 [Rhynchosporium graminicola]
MVTSRCSALSKLDCWELITSNYNSTSTNMVYVSQENLNRPPSVLYTVFKMLRPASTKIKSSSQADGLELPRTTLGNHASFSSDSGKSKISPEQLGHILERLGFDHTRSEVEVMLNSIKQHDEDAIELDDFLSALDSKISKEASDTETARAFEVFDRGNSGQITSDGLYSVLETLGQRIDKNQLGAVFKEADLDRDGVISYDDFHHFVKRNENRPT